MSKKEKFIAETTPRYTAKGHFFTLGKGILDGEVIPFWNSSHRRNEQPYPRKI